MGSAARAVRAAGDPAKKEAARRPSTIGPAAGERRACMTGFHGDAKGVEASHQILSPRGGQATLRGDWKGLRGDHGIHWQQERTTEYTKYTEKEEDKKSDHAQRIISSPRCFRACPLSVFFPCISCIPWFLPAGPSFEISFVRPCLRFGLLRCRLLRCRLLRCRRLRCNAVADCLPWPAS